MNNIKPCDKLLIRNELVEILVRILYAQGKYLGIILIN